MRDDHHGAGVFLDEPLEVSFPVQVEVIVRLVEEQDVRMGQQDARQADQLLLAAAQLPDRLGPGCLFQAQAAQGFLDAPGVLVASQRGILLQAGLLLLQHAGQQALLVVDSRVFQAGFQPVQLGFQRRPARVSGQRRFQHGLARVQFGLLGQVAEAHPAGPDDVPTRLGRVFAGDQPEQRSLAGPVGSD